MKKVFDKIAEECKQKNLNRFPTNIDGIQNFEDMKLVLKKIMEYLEEENKKSLL